ncbi:MAG: hypothetical protein JNJ40_17350 [Bacteroidia bacterium]|nr:hypothetical protein [Bacteroidia bacterium]
MKTYETQKNQLEDSKVSVKLKLASLWTSFMFLYIYVDYFHLYMPNILTDIQKGKVFVFDITQGFIFIALFLATIPILMIFLSIVLPAKINRLTNIIAAIVLIPYMLFNLAGEAWLHMYFAAVVEVVLLCLIILYAYKWSRIKIENL